MERDKETKEGMRRDKIQVKLIREVNLAREGKGHEGSLGKRRR